MPAYNANTTTNTPLNALYSGDAGFAVFNAENPANGAKSQQVALGGPYGEGGQHNCFASSSYASVPAATSWKVQHAATDVDNAYTDIANATSTNVNGDNILFSTSLPFIRVVQVTQPGVNQTIKVGKK